MWTEDINALEMILRTIVTFTVLLLLTRFLGKEQLSQLTMFNYITGITIGSIAADIAGQEETPFIDGMISLIMWTLLTLLVSWISLKSMRAKTLIDDEPSVVIRKGKILQRELKSSRLPVEDLKMLLRLQGIFSITEVEHAILETNGELSVYKKAANQPATKKDMQVSAKPPHYIPTQIITDGVIIERNLKELGLTSEWLQTELKKAGYRDASQIFYAELQENGKLYIDSGNDD
ncbi:YetF domain-containing protein [Chryseomicrobium palamuruense]|uniref:YetF domain-containing protein n=1 Tax=Chryseomicrobium palamuruense TaxID=682973 RepID=A0ABV8UTC3_9BACL